MPDEPFILPTFTFDTFRKSRLEAEKHVVGAPRATPAVGASESRTDSERLFAQLKDEGIEIDSPYEAFFTDGAPPEISKR